MLAKLRKLIFDTLLHRILGGSCNNEWILEETGNSANNDGDIIASCMETDDDEKGKDDLLHASVDLWPVNGQIQKSQRSWKTRAVVDLRLPYSFRGFSRASDIARPV